MLGLEEVRDYLFLFPLGTEKKKGLQNTNLFNEKSLLVFVT